VLSLQRNWIFLSVDEGVPRNFGDGRCLSQEQEGGGFFANPVLPKSNVSNFMCFREQFVFANRFGYNTEQ
jgi:hypothetical protein